LPSLRKFLLIVVFFLFCTSLSHHKYCYIYVTKKYVYILCMIEFFYWLLVSKTRKKTLVIYASVILKYSLYKIRAYVCIHTSFFVNIETQSYWYPALLYIETIVGFYSTVSANIIFFFEIGSHRSVSEDIETNMSTGAQWLITFRS
jgi:hypothetical protein